MQEYCQNDKISMTCNYRNNIIFVLRHPPTIGTNHHGYSLHLWSALKTLLVSSPHDAVHDVAKTQPEVRCGHCIDNEEGTRLSVSFCDHTGSQADHPIPVRILSNRHNHKRESICGVNPEYTLTHGEGGREGG